MKKLIISVFMVTSLCLVTVGFVRTVAAQVPEPSIEKVVTDGPDVDIDGTIDIVVETKQTGATSYQFTIEYDNGGDLTDVIIKDTIPAEWNVMVINTVTVGPVKDKDGIASIDTGDGNGTFTVVRSGKDPKGEGPKPPKASPKKNNSSTQICWIPPTDSGTYILTVTVETRQSPSGKPKWAPTSCGLLVLNPGATAFEYDPTTGEIVLDGGLPVVLAEPTDPLELVAVADLDETDGVVADGIGDEDGDGFTDADEVLIFETDPCSSDTDGDGLTDDVEIVSCTDPTNADTDNDGLSDGVETDTGTFVDSTDTGTDPCDADSDDDGCDDGVEVGAGTDPNDDQDFSCF